MKFIFLILVSYNIFAQNLIVIEPYIREVPPTSKNSAAFMKLKNTTDKSIIIIGAKSDISKAVELHNHTLVNGMMKMRQIKEILVPPKSIVELKPKSLHVMFIGLKDELREGNSHKLSLIQKNGNEVKIIAPVKSIKRHRH